MDGEAGSFIKLRVIKVIKTRMKDTEELLEDEIEFHYPAFSLLPKPVRGQMGLYWLVRDGGRDRDRWEVEHNSSDVFESHSAVQLLEGENDPKLKRLIARIEKAYGEAEAVEKAEKARRDADDKIWSEMSYKQRLAWAEADNTLPRKEPRAAWWAKWKTMSPKEREAWAVAWKKMPQKEKEAWAAKVVADAGGADGKTTSRH